MYITVSGLDVLGIFKNKLNVNNNNNNLIASQQETLYVVIFLLYKKSSCPVLSVGGDTELFPFNVPQFPTETTA